MLDNSRTVSAPWLTPCIVCSVQPNAIKGPKRRERQKRLRQNAMREARRVKRVNLASRLSFAICSATKPAEMANGCSPAPPWTFVSSHLDAIRIPARSLSVGSADERARRLCTPTCDRSICATGRALRHGLRASAAVAAAYTFATPPPNLRSHHHPVEARSSQHDPRCDISVDRAGLGV